MQSRLRRPAWGNRLVPPVYATLRQAQAPRKKADPLRVPALVSKRLSR